MSESTGPQDASTLVLRISVPAGAEYQAIVKELAAKVAAYVGDTDPDGRAAAAALEQVAQVVKPAPSGQTDAPGAGHGLHNNNDDVVFEFRQTADALLIRARGAGRSADARRPLPS
jgi:hypothetical protein